MYGTSLRDLTLEAALAACPVVEAEADDGFAVVDFLVVDHLHDFGEGHADDFDLLVEFGGGDAFAEVAGEVNLHPLAEEAGAGEVFEQEGPTPGAEAGLFDEFALGGGEGSFAGLAGAGGEFDEVLAGGVAILAFEDDVGVGGIGAVVDGEHDDGAVVADDVADVAMAAGLDEGVGVDIEDSAFEGEFGGDEFGAGAGFGPGGLGGGGLFGLPGGGGHGSTVSSCIGVVDGASN